MKLVCVYVPLSATPLSRVMGFAWVITLMHLDPSRPVYSICSWNGRCGLPSMVRGATSFSFGVAAESGLAVSSTCVCVCVCVGGGGGGRTIHVRNL